MKYAFASEIFVGFSWTLEPWRKKGLRKFEKIEHIPDDHCLIVPHFAPWWAPLSTWVNEGRPYIEIDYGYWGPILNQRREVRRVTYCNHHNINILPRTTSRINIFPDPPIEPWRDTPGEYVLVPLPIEKLLQERTGKTMFEWKLKMSEIINQYWTGPIVWREKIGKSSRFDTFKEQVKNAHAVVGERTMACTEAVLLGVPAFTIDQSMSTLIMGGVENLANPKKPDRTDWFDHICWSQFQPEEFSESTLVADLVEQYQIYGKNF